MDNDSTPAALRLSDQLGRLVAAEMAAYYEGEYMDHSVARARLRDFAASIAAAERERICNALPGGHSVDPQWVADVVRGLA